MLSSYPLFVQYQNLFINVKFVAEYNGTEMFYVKNEVNCEYGDNVDKKFGLASLGLALCVKNSRRVNTFHLVLFGFVSF